MGSLLSVEELCVRLWGRPHEPSYAGRLGASVLSFMALASVVFLFVDESARPIPVILSSAGLLMAAAVFAFLPWDRIPASVSLLPVPWMYVLLTWELSSADQHIGHFLMLFPMIGLYLGLTQRPWSSVFFLPISIGSVLIGVFASHNSSSFPQAFLAVAVSGACGDSLALVVQRDSATRHRLEELLVACGELAAVPTISEASDLVARLAGELLGASQSFVLLSEAPGSTMLTVTGTYQSAFSDALYKIDWTEGQSGIALVMRSGEPLFVQDARSSSLLNRECVEMAGTSSLIYIPIRGEGGQIGLVGALWTVGRPRFDANARRIIEVLSAQAGPVLERLRANSRLTHESQTDPLTGLPNRRALVAALGRLPVGGCVVFLDLDHFKELNDGYGHATGDAVLSAFGRLLSELPREDRDLAIRTGGEEFVMIVHEATLENCTAMVQRLRSAWSTSVPPVTFSAGIARRSHNEEPIETLARADNALYRAKDAGRDRIVTDPLESVSSSLH